MKKVVAIMLSVILVIVCCTFTVTAKNAVITPQLQEIIENSNPNDIISVEIFYKGNFKNVDEMPSWPDRDAATKELNAYADEIQSEYQAVIFDGIDVSTINYYQNAWMIDVDVKISDIQKIVDSGLVQRIYYLDNTNGEAEILTDEQKQQITAIMDVAKWYTTNDSVGNPVTPPYDEAYTTEMGEISDRIMKYGNLLLFDKGDLSQFNSVNSDYARLLTLLDNPVINPRFAAYTCYLSFKENNYKSWYSEDAWQQFVTYRNALYETLTNINEDYLHIDTTALTNIQKKEITAAFFDLLELYDKMTLVNAKSGDVDGDGEATVIDVTVMQRNLIDMVDFTEGQKLRATTNANASVNGPDYDITSATVLQRFLIGIGTENFDAIQSYNFPPQEIWPTHAHYPNPEALSKIEYRNISIWNPIICITNYADVRLTEIDSQ